MGRHFSDDEVKIYEAYFAQRFEKRMRGYKGLPLTDPVRNSIKAEFEDEWRLTKEDIRQIKKDRGFVDGDETD